MSGCLVSSALLAWQGVGGLLFVIPVLGDLHVIVLLSKFLAVVQACGGIDFLAANVLTR